MRFRAEGGSRGGRFVHPLFLGKSHHTKAHTRNETSRGDGDWTATGRQNVGLTGKTCAGSRSIRLTETGSV